MTADLTQPGDNAVAPEDLDLVHATKKGDITAFEQLVLRYQQKLLRVAQNITHNREDSQDAVQEALLKAFQNLGEFRDCAKFSTWLFRILVNQCLMKLRDRHRTNEEPLKADSQLPEDLIAHDIADRAPNPEEHFRVSELLVILTKALMRLPPILRTVFVLRDIEGLSTDHTAEFLGLTSSTVKTRLFCARSQLRRFMSNHFIGCTNNPVSPAFIFQQLPRSLPVAVIVQLSQCSTVQVQSEIPVSISKTKPIRTQNAQKSTFDSSRLSLPWANPISHGKAGPAP
jgi:RNA polymerase sigma-70 factor (ECF subfamily)